MYASACCRTIIVLGGFTFDGMIVYSSHRLHSRHNIEITHMTRPLLLTRSKARDLRAGVPETVYLVPELCRMMVLIDEMRCNHRLMSALAEHTHAWGQASAPRSCSCSANICAMSPWWCKNSNN